MACPEANVEKSDRLPAFIDLAANDGGRSMLPFRFQNFTRSVESITGDGRQKDSQPVMEQIPLTICECPLAYRCSTGLSLEWNIRMRTSRMRRERMSTSAPRICACRRLQYSVHTRIGLSTQGAPVLEPQHPDWIPYARHTQAGMGFCLPHTAAASLPEDEYECA